MGTMEIVSRRIRGNNVKNALKTAEFANVVDPNSRKVLRARILQVTKNSANKDYERRGVITKGALLETESGTARVVSRPGQDGTVNAILEKQ
jgi:small subunit ribosomal protein S8e